MSKLVSVFLSSCLVFALAVQACGKSDSNSGSGGGGGEASGGSGGEASGGSGGAAGGGAGMAAQGGSGGQSSTTGGAGGNNAAGGSAGGTAGSAGGVGGSAGGAAGGTGGMVATTGMSFFLTSVNPGQGGGLAGLEGADAHCKKLAMAVGAGARQWRAYLSTDTVDARSRIGAGPWQNQKAVVVATSVADLHSANNQLSRENSIDERGRGVNSNRHDILTGSNADGTKRANVNCTNWTSSARSSNAVVGHHDRMGGNSPVGMSWNAAHDSSGCGLADLKGTGGDGLFYCFASD